MTGARDHGGGIDAAAQRFGGARADWIDLSTGINPVAYPLPALDPQSWTALPDRGAQDALIRAARDFWQVPAPAAVLPVAGLSSIIGGLPGLTAPGRVTIPGPTYNEYAPAFRAAGFDVADDDARAGDAAAVIVHPNNPTGAWRAAPPRDIALRVIDESFCDTDPGRSLMALAAQPGTLVLKGLGKFWGLAGLRLGVVIGDPALIDRLRARAGPWAVSGPALTIGTAALRDTEWADRTRARLAGDAGRLDQMLAAAGAVPAGGTTLFRLYEIENAQALQTRLAEARIWTRIFPWSDRHIRIGLPTGPGWDRLGRALAG